MKGSRLKSLCVEIYKSINSINPSFVDEIFRLRVTKRFVVNTDQGLMQGAPTAANAAPRNGSH